MTKYWKVESCFYFSHIKNAFKIGNVVNWWPLVKYFIGKARPFLPRKLYCHNSSRVSSKGDFPRQKYPWQYSWLFLDFSIWLHAWWQLSPCKSQQVVEGYSTTFTIFKFFVLEQTSCHFFWGCGLAAALTQQGKHPGRAGKGTQLLFLCAPHS